MTAAPGRDRLDAGVDDAASFEALRSAGIAALQDLCGEVWTDYNLHDPGVTTFEQLAYGLTDLAYRTGFDMADYLTGPDGLIDYAGLALYPPEDILPGAPLTIEDYRRLLYGEIPELADVWIRAEGGGLLAIDVLADHDGSAAAPAGETVDAAALARQVRQVYAGNRALGADLARVRVLEPRACYLRGEIDTWGERSQAEVLAQILFDCGQYLSSGLTAQRLRDVIALDWSPERVYDGPATRHGHVGVRPGGDDGAPVTVSELIGVIQKIEGVRRIRSLSIVDAELRPLAGIPRDRADGACGVLPFPAGETLVELLRVQPEQGIEYGVSEQMIPPAPAWRSANRLLYEEARLELAKLRFERRAFRADDSCARTRYALPSGTYRELHAYYSVQHEFPAVYGVGQYGLPESASAERKAQARQLQGYLYPMEQLMANYLQNLQEFPRLFGLGHEDTHSYGSQYLAGQAAPGVEALYRESPDATRARLARVLARQDEHMERKGRVYDYLLAIYGETFPQTALRRFNHYHPHDTDVWLLDAKRRLLEELVGLSARRGSGADYTLPPDAAGAVSPLARRAAILLGFDAADGRRSLCPARGGARLALDEEDESAHGAMPPAAPDDWLPLPPASGRAAAPSGGFLARRDRLDEALFRDGALLANYRLARSGGAYQLHVQAGAHWRMLGSHARRDVAVAAAHAAVAELADLNRGCEGMHIVEHLLLRPGLWRDDAGRHAPGEGLGNPSFYAAHISVVLPRWTLRCADRGFRNLVEETVREHCPAHIQPGFLWLGPAAMAQFEQLHDAWRDALRSWHAADEGERGREEEPLTASLHDAAGVLVHFLRAHRKEPT
ncbi:hypothetical protein SOM61_00295 [Massilia sp. CFBP9012]|uniref:hypothetical protein n=1 Tax=Massilia sp. CFBP9012 TaxID=3096531 RepID=UPI002A6AC2E1|nr:hypothetical protein [Massilia sp. CFBP9012]MDY0973383.1 hypothetical protein [Massilia sp. CFBP9012]